MRPLPMNVAESLIVTDGRLYAFIFIGDDESEECWRFLLCDVHNDHWTIQ